MRLWEDGTFDAHVYHSGPGDETQLVQYERTISEIVWERWAGDGWEGKEIGGETLHTPAVDNSDVRVITTVEPPYE